MKYSWTELLGNQRLQGSFLRMPVHADLAGALCDLVLRSIHDEGVQFNSSL